MNLCWRLLFDLVTSPFLSLPRDIEIFMDLLDKLEEKIILALETIELLNMENEELKEEVAKLKTQNTDLGEQKTTWESKVNSMLSQFGSEVAELNKIA